MPQKFSIRNSFVGRLPLRVAFVLFLLLLVACTGGKKPEVDVAVGANASAGEASKDVVQDSLRAKFLLTIAADNDSPQELDAVLFSVPGKRYRMELTGPMGIGVASMLWMEEGWTMTFPTEKLYMKGAGYMVGLLNNASIPMVHIHQVAALFEGKLLPENFDVVEKNMEVPADLMDPSIQVVYGREKSGRVFAFGRQDSSVVWLTRPGRDGIYETLKFFDVKEFEGRALASRIVFEKGGRRFLEIRIKKVNRNKAFSLGTWRLNVPRSFNPVEQ